ncbi:MAG: glycine cleavage system aminomethyltransferase GcvT [Elainellaceae cyanobacterium]
MTDALRRTPLYDLAIAQKARMTPFSGWEMPVQFSGITQEHQAVRQSVGVFDISHMGKFVLRGDEILAKLQRLVPTDLSGLQRGAAQYTVLLNPQGGIVDDFIIYAQGADRADLIVNAATTEKDKTWLLEHLSGVELEDLSSDRALLAVQGPEAIATLQKFVAEDLSQVPKFGHLEGSIFGEPGFLARTGYTGEDGFEVMVKPDTGRELWRSLLDTGAIPCGLGARDTLRLEAAMALYGQDIDDTTTPLEAGLGWLVHLDKVPDFIGRDVLMRQKQDGVSRRLVGLQLTGRNIARHDYPVLHSGEPIGKVTSGTLSPTLGYPVAMAYVLTDLAKVGQILEVEIRGKSYPATIVKRPFYKR